MEALLDFMLKLTCILGLLMFIIIAGSLTWAMAGMLLQAAN